jgi:Na+/proline symporter
VWGLVSVFFSVTIAPIVFAIVFGILGIRRSRRLEDGGLGARGYGMSVAGLVLGIIGAVMLLLAVVGLVLALVFTAHPPVRSYPS